MSTLAQLLAAALAIRVTGPAGGFRRAGFAFGPEPVIISLDLLDHVQVGDLIAEPRLTVEIGTPPDDWTVVGGVGPAVNSALADDVTAGLRDDLDVVRVELQDERLAHQATLNLYRKVGEERDALSTEADQLRADLEAARNEIAALTAAKADAPTDAETAAGRTTATKKPKAPSPTAAEG